MKDVGQAWTNAKAAGAIQPAGQITPGPKVWTGEGDPKAALFKDWIPDAKWTEGMRTIAGFAKRSAERNAGCASKAGGSVPSLPRQSELTSGVEKEHPPLQTVAGALQAKLL